MRFASPALLPLVLLAAACGGPRQPGPKPNETLFWRVEKQSTEFGDCSDEPGFRSDFTTPALGSAVALVDGTGKKATQQFCLPAPDNNMCTEAVVMDVVGSELALGSTDTLTIGGTTCKMGVARNFLIEDQGMKMTATDALTLTLVGDPDECARVQQSVRAQSPNGLGWNGCTIALTLEGVLQ